MRSGWRERRSEAPESFDAPAHSGRKHFDANRRLTVFNCCNHVEIASPSDGLRQRETMNNHPVRVLILGETNTAPSRLLTRLQKSACECWFAKSADRGAELLDKYGFEVILSIGPVHDALQMVSRLAGSECSIFSAFPVERGCWWLPIMYMGEECLGAPAMRTGEFLALLDQALRHLLSSGMPAIIGLQEAGFRRSSEVLRDATTFVSEIAPALESL
jgi:hypothetical protein